MGNIVILAETGSDLPKEIAKRFSVILVPMHVTFNDVTKDDGAFPVEEAAKKLEYKNITWIKTGCVITTHGGPGAFGMAGFAGE